MLREVLREVLLEVLVSHHRMLREVLLAPARAYRVRAVLAPLALALGAVVLAQPLTPGAAHVPQVVAAPAEVLLHEHVPLEGLVELQLEVEQTLL